MSDETAQLIERLRSRLRQALRRMTRAKLAFGVAVAAGSIAALWLIAATLEATFWLQPDLRTGLLALSAATILGVGATYLARPLGRLLGVLDGPSDEDVARAIGQHHPAVADRLVNLLQLAEGERSHAPAPYVDRAVQHLAAQIDEVKFDEVADFEPARTAARWAALPLLALFVFLVAAPSTFLGASERLLAPQTEFARPTPFQFTVTPGNAQLVKGDSLQITIQATGTAPKAATVLLQNSDDESPQRISLQADPPGTFHHTVPNVRQPLRYRIVAAPVRTEWFTVDVANRPVLQQLQVRVTPPAYTNRDSRTLAPNVGDVNALPGSRIRIAAALGGAPVAEASVEFENGSSHPLTLSSDSATGAFALRREDTYVIRLQSENDVPNRAPIRYELSPKADAQPSVSFLKPESPAELTPALTQDLRLQLSDDYGFRRIALFYRTVNGSSRDSSFSSFELALDAPQQRDQILTHTWLLTQESGLTLERGDEVAYYVKAWDNDTVNGPKSSRTPTQRLRFPSLSEQYEEFNELQEETGDQMQELNRKSQSLQQQFQKMRKELRRTREADWEDRRKLEQMQERQNSLQEGQRELSQQVDSLNREMQRKDLSSPETSEQFQELKKTIDEMKNSEALQKSLEKLRKSMQKRSFPQMQQNMDQTRSRLQQQKEQLERTMKLFKQLQARQKMEELKRRAQDMVEREEDVAEKTEERMTSPSDSTRKGERSSSDSTSSDSAQPSPSSRSDSTTASQADSSRTSPTDSTASPSDSLSQQSPSPDSSANEDLAQEQEEMAKEMEKLMESMKEARQKMKDTPSAPRKKMQQMQQQMQRQDLPKKMRQNSQKLRKNQLQKAQQQQQQLQKRLQSMESRLSKMQQQMQSRQQQMNMTGLRSALENILRLSDNQESLRRTVETLSGDGPTVRRQAPRQQGLREGLTHVADSLEAIASRLPRMSQAVKTQTGNALRAMEDATTSLDEEEAKQAAGFQKTSMKHLNELALLLSSLLNRMQQQSGGGGQMSMQQAMQQLQKASGQQQKLNKQIQQFLNQAQGERLSKDMKQRRKQLAQQQRKIKQQLEEMNVDEETKQKLLGDLQKIAKQMQNSAEDLEGGRHSRDLIERQQQILTRLLNAQQSLRTQGKKQQRRGQRAEENIDQERPGDRSTPDDNEALRRDLIRALEMGYNSDYEALIKRYFELLQERQQRAPQN